MTLGFAYLVDYDGSNHPTTWLAKPVIAQIDALCVGGGVALALALALCCDVSICGESSRFVVPRRGWGWAWLLRHHSPVRCGRDAGHGIVNRAATDDRGAATADDMARMIAENAPMTIDPVKSIVDRTVTGEAERDLDRRATLVKQCFESQDHTEGGRVFMEDRRRDFASS